MRRVCLVGAGFIAGVHADVIGRDRRTRLAAVVDRDLEAARRLARRWRVADVFSDAAEAVAAGGVDCAHICTPPDSHAAAARPFLEAGLPVLVEKPLAASSAEAEQLIELAAARRAVLGVNQNFVHHPAFAALRGQVEARALGGLVAVSCVYAMPLRQLAARQLGHWMFRQPLNLLLEQAVHPLSQLAALAGEPGNVQAQCGPLLRPMPEVALPEWVNVSLAGARVPAQLHFTVGRAFPWWRVEAVCEDGVLVADMVRNRLIRFDRGPGLEPLDEWRSAARAAAQLRAAGRRNALAWALATLRLTGRSDAFHHSMRASILDFHRALDGDRPPVCDGRFGAALVAQCERIAAQMPAAPAPRPTVAAGRNQYDVAVLGGTGFIGAKVVEALLAAGRTVAVMARHPNPLPALYHDPRVAVLAGDVRSPDDVARAIGTARVVVNLAHGGGAANWDEARRGMVDSARVVAEACLAAGIERLVHVSSIAALYCGDGGAVLTDEVQPDPQAHRRAPYARAKAEAERLLLEMHRQRALPVVILRPGVVVGDGGQPFHTALGSYNNEQHCLGWNQGRNPLPFVLVGDVAGAVVAAATRPGLAGRSYNLVGEVALSARDYTTELARAMGRPLRFHPGVPPLLWSGEVGKWLVKRATGRPAAFLSLRDLRSRGLTARFDIAAAKRDLDWRPESDRGRFLRAALPQRAAP